MTPIKAVCLTLLDAKVRHHSAIPNDHARRDAHFRERGVDAAMFVGVPAANVGLYTDKPYDLDAGQRGAGSASITPDSVGCWIGHRMLWAALLLLPDETFLVLEDDAELALDWRKRTERAIADCPPDWDIILIGSAGCADKPQTHVAGEVFEVRWPFCTHAYVVRRKALRQMIDALDEAGCYAPIDIAMGFHCYPRLKTYTMLPRAVGQFDTELAP